MGKDLLDVKELKKALDLLKPNNALFEIRIHTSRNFVLSGYFKDADIAIQQLQYKRNDLIGSNVYFTLNEVKEACYSRKQKNQFLAIKPTTSKNDIERYTTFFVDIDPERATGVSSTKEEFDYAAKKVNDVYLYLKKLGFKEPVFACSGNGYHLLYRINLPYTEESEKLVTNCLETLSFLYTDDKAKVDTANSDPNRICKLYGTLAQKGADTEERPHRMSKILRAPTVFEETSEDILHKLVSQVQIEEPPKKTYTGSKSDSFDMEEWLNRYNIGYRETTWKQGCRKFILNECPFDSTHTDGDAAVIVFPNGGIAFHCFHNSCQNKTWKDFRLKYEPDAYNNKGKKKKSESDRKPAFTIEALRNELFDRKISLRYNSISNDVEITWVDSGFSSEDLGSALPSLLRSELSGKYARCSKDAIMDFLEYIAREKRYNPVLDVINSTKWDGEDRLPELFEILDLPDDDSLSKKLIVKWLWQGLALLENTREKDLKAQGVLVLKGGQGIGKTTFLSEIAKLTPNCHYFRDGQSIDGHDKDTKRRCITTWIAELGELDSTFKRSDLGALKAFITTGYDEYRLPYGVKDEKVPRRTNLCASVNESDYLIDPTGNRRFWTIPVDTIDIEGIKKFNSLQLWAQIRDQYYLKDKKGFFLDQREIAELEKRNNLYAKPITGQLEVEDVLYRLYENPNYSMELMTVSDFINSHEKELGRIKASQIGKVLTKLGYADKRKKIEGRTVRLRELPVVQTVPFQRAKIG